MARGHRYKVAGGSDEVRYATILKVSDCDQILNDEYLQLKWWNPEDGMGELSHLWSFISPGTPEVPELSFLPVISTWEEFADTIGRILQDLPLSIALVPPEWQEEILRRASGELFWYTWLMDERSPWGYVSFLGKPEGLHVRLKSRADPQKIEYILVPCDVLDRRPTLVTDMPDWISDAPYIPQREISLDELRAIITAATEDNKSKAG